MRMPRLSVTRVMSLIAVLAILLRYVIVPIGRIDQWMRLERKIESRIRHLQPSEPNSIDPNVWNCARQWILYALGESCQVPGNPANHELMRLIEDLEAKLQGKVDLETLKWIWYRLGKVGRSGESYTRSFMPQFQKCLETGQFD